MPPDSTATRKRLLDAAEAEFARYGVAGARVDRIAAEAGANKRLIYVYYGNKQQLFDTVVTAARTRLAAAVPVHTDDLPGYAGSLFDAFVANPEILRLTLWRSLERPAHAAADLDLYRTKVIALRARREDGKLPATFDPVDLLAIVEALATTWFLTSPALASLAADGPSTVERLAVHREAVIETVRRMLELP
ncbi:TetR family transcriptional regulator [Pseudonocardia sp. GCM10023141]|uniref:TetR family transcriptional regulator n=1 Tax=Pseudonocardia sp. GCM10023141 TaxID=3252653 RepID=UPI00361DC9A5